MSRQFASALRHEDITFNWSDVIPMQLRNESSAVMTFARAEIIQGGTDGAGVAGVVALNLPSTHYVITTPAAFPKGEVTSQQPVGVEYIRPGEYITASITTPNGAAKEATLRIHYWQE